MSPSELFKQSNGQTTDRSDTIVNRTPLQTAAEMKYVAHYAISSATEARALSRQNAWEILEYLRSVGSSGSSAREISEALSLPVSDVYSSLKDLSQLELVFALPKRMLPTGERRRRIVSETSVWNRYKIDTRLAKVLETDGEMKDLVNSLITPLSNVASKVQSRVVEPYKRCPRCGLNHDMAEFLFAITLTALNSIMLNIGSFKEWPTNTKSSWLPQRT
jgi:DNA-binding MarR family transcriptional regulator